jgi:hypothetical protein
MSSYSDAGSMIIARLTFENLPAVATDFNRPGLRAAILDSQCNGQEFRQFSYRAVEAGVQAYYAFLRGQRVTYLGRQGKQHIEWFPAAPRPDTEPFLQAALFTTVRLRQTLGDNLKRSSTYTPCVPVHRLHLRQASCRG